MLILGNPAVRATLDGRDPEVLDAVRQAYLHHARDESVLPHSVFLRFPHDTRNRVIGLPAYLGGADPVAGMKWIASFPGNTAEGMARASATIVLNSTATGHPLALLEGSVISARRTAASAALAAAALPAREPDTGVSLIGCGVINAEVLRFLRLTCPGLRELTVFDLDRERAQRFAARYGEGLAVTVADKAGEALAAHPLVCLATTAGVPHTDLTECRPGTLVLHLSLRDVSVDGVLAAVNITDDADHVCRAATSLHLAEQQVGHREFITGTLGGLLSADSGGHRDERRITLFSPFGLGILDMAVARLVLSEARRAGLGVDLPDFLGPDAVPTPATPS